MAQLEEVTKKIEKSSSSSIKEFGHLLLGVKAGYFGGVTPYKFEEDCGRLWFDDGLLRKWICYSEFVLCNLYMSHLCWGWTWALVTENPNSPKRIGLQYMFFCSCIPFCMQVNNFLHYGQHHFVINSYMQLTDTTAKKGKSDGGFDSFLMTLRRIGVCVTILNLMAIVRRPFLPYLMTSRFPNDLPRLVTAPLAGLQLYAFVTQWISVYGKMGQISAYLKVILFRLNKLKFEAKMQRKDRRGEIFQEYRQLQILQINFDALYSQFLIHFEVVAIIAIILGILAGVRVEGAQGLRPILAGGASLLMLLFVWIKMAQVNEFSEEVLHSWKFLRSGHDALFSKLLRSTLPIRVRLGTFFFADRSLVLTILTIIINNTVTLLVAK